MMIEFANVTKYFGRHAAASQCSLAVPAHQAVALWGENGAGKTTLIKCLLGLLHYEGQIFIHGLDAARAGRQARRMVGYVPQELAYYNELSTLEMACLIARLKRASPANTLAVLAQVGLEEHIHKPVAALSGGMKQRLALGLAMLGDPPVLVLDEPTSNLDAAGRSQFLQLLAQLKATGKTVFFTSHRLEEIEQLADQVVVMERGVIKLHCTGHELASRLDLRTTLKLHLPEELLTTALDVLHGDGCSARRNGTGVLVEVHPGKRAQPIHSLNRARIVVTDFEME
jgi:ABC-2 type transport system ATP-binding protein